MKALLTLAFFFTTTLASATTPWEVLSDRVLREGTRLESNFGVTKHLERRQGNEVAYLTIEINTDTGEAKRYSAVIENVEQTPEGKIIVNQSLFWFTPIGELAVVSRYRITFKADRSYESREEIAFGVEPDAADLARWDALLNEWVKEL